MYGPQLQESSPRSERRGAVRPPAQLRRPLVVAARLVLLASVGLHAPAQARLHPVRIDNPEGRALTLQEVDEGTGTLVTPRRLADPQIDLMLPLGRRFWVTVDSPSGACELPIPLTARTVLPARLELRVPSVPERDPDFAFVPAGPSLVGDTLGVGQPDERPARVVDVAAFWIARFEVTNRDYAAFLDARLGTSASAWIDLGSRKCRIRRDEATGRHVSDHPEEPVVTVSHAGAVAYCAWRTEVSGSVHRLPTAVEWEKAARGPRSATFSYGDIYERASANQESGRLAAVGTSGPMTGFGTFDMTGNAFEWTADAYPSSADEGDPGYRELRGGSFVLDGMYLRNAFRMKLRPGVRADDVGFRVVRELTQTDRPSEQENRR
ncbi:MAG: hypothetical protein RL562_3335 [Planctomycetota bacterium]